MKIVRIDGICRSEKLDSYKNKKKKKNREREE
jgi:hypothetical protein